MNTINLLVLAQKKSELESKGKPEVRMDSIGDQAIPHLLKCAAIEGQSKGYMWTMVCTNLIGLIAVAAQNKVVLKQDVLPKNINTSLYLCDLADSGTGKSAVKSLTLKPLFDMQKSIEDENRKNRDFYNSPDGGIVKAKIKYLERNISKLTEQEKAELARLKEEFKDEIPNYLYQDVTSSALYEGLNKKSKAILVNDEAHVLFRYIRKDEEYQFFCSLWDGKPIFKDRGRRGRLYIDCPQFSMLLAIQTSVFFKFLEKDDGELLASGLAARMLTFQHKREDANITHKCDEGFLNYMNMLANYLLSLPENYSLEIELCGEAKNLCLEYKDMMHEEVCEHDGSESASFLGRAVENMLKIAIVYELIHSACGSTSLSKQSVMQAIEMMTIFKQHHDDIFTSKRTEADWEKGVEECVSKIHEILQDKSFLRIFKTTNGLFHWGIPVAAINPFLKNKFRSGKNNKRMWQEIDAKKKCHLMMGNCERSDFTGRLIYFVQSPYLQPPRTKKQMTEALFFNVNSKNGGHYPRW